MGVKTTVQDETTNIHENISKMAKTKLSLVSKYLRQQKSKKEEEQEEEISWDNRPLHSM